LFNASRRLTLLAVLVVVLFAAGLIQLFLLRFKAGDIYPAYSSLRSDPLGTQVLFESLNLSQQGAARRNFRRLDRLELGAGTTLLICGLTDDDRFLEDPEIRELMDQVALSGSRLVLAFTPGRSSRKNQAPDEETAGPCPEDANGSETEAPVDDDQALQDEEDAAGPEAWLGAASMGFDIQRFTDKASEDTAVNVASDLHGLPELIPWHTPLFFELDDEAWVTLYTWEQEPVMVRRPWGRGSVVMIADSYLLSNEGLRRHRFSNLLSWLLVPGHRTIFDEFHHGLVRQPGISALARQYRLYGVFGALMVVVGLLVWRQAVVFVPLPQAVPESDDSLPAAGRDTTEGLVDLVRRHISARNLLDVCYQTWLPYGTQRVPQSLVAQIGTLVQQAAGHTKGRSPVDTYRAVCKMLERYRSGPQ
jgi:hypothetical protein